MKLLMALCLCVWVTAGFGEPAHARTKYYGYALRDTTSLPPPTIGTARLVVARDMRLTQDLKPEFVYVDQTPIGVLAQRTAISTEVAPGWHRVWLGRGSKIQVWMEFVPDGRYLLRLRETMSGGGTWRGDLVREGAEGYAQFALSKGMKLSVMDKTGNDFLAKDVKKFGNTAKQDSIARAQAIAQAALPIVVKEAWYLPLPTDAPSSDWEHDTGTLTLDDRSLRFARKDQVALEIPRDSVSAVYFGSQRGGYESPWIKVAYHDAHGEQGATFADATPSTSTENYNRLFAELVKRMAPSRE